MTYDPIETIEWEKWVLDAYEREDKLKRGAMERIKKKQENRNKSTTQ